MSCSTFVRSLSSHILSVTSQDLDVESRINCSTKSTKFLVNPLLLKEKQNNKMELMLLLTCLAFFSRGGCGLFNWLDCSLVSVSQAYTQVSSPAMTFEKNKNLGSLAACALRSDQTSSLRCFFGQRQELRAQTLIIRSSATVMLWLPQLISTSE